jgi:hypothetical protein
MAELCCLFCLGQTTPPDTWLSSSMSDQCNISNPCWTQINCITYMGNLVPVCMFGLSYPCVEEYLKNYLKGNYSITPDKMPGLQTTNCIIRGQRPQYIVHLAWDTRTVNLEKYGLLDQYLYSLTSSSPLSVLLLCDPQAAIQKLSHNPQKTPGFQFSFLRIVYFANHKMLIYHGFLQLLMFV